MPLTALEAKTDLLSRWRRKFMPDEIKALSIDLQSLIDISTKEGSNHMNQLLSVSDIARIRNVKLATAKRWLDKGFIPFHKVGHIRVVTWDDLNKFTPNKVGRPTKETNNEM